MNTAQQLRNPQTIVRPQQLFVCFLLYLPERTLDFYSIRFLCCPHLIHMTECLKYKHAFVTTQSYCFLLNFH